MEVVDSSFRFLPSQVLQERYSAFPSPCNVEVNFKKKKKFSLVEHPCSDDAVTVALG